MWAATVRSGAVPAIRVPLRAVAILVLLHKVLALDLRHLDAHALLGERNLSSWPTRALYYFELGVAIRSLTVGEEFDGVLPWVSPRTAPSSAVCMDSRVRSSVAIDVGRDGDDAAPWEPRDCDLPGRGRQVGVRVAFRDVTRAGGARDRFRYG